jgi:hypothetical protein
MARVSGTRRIGSVLGAVAALLALAVPSGAIAQTAPITPTEFDDQPESPGCTVDDCTLREAVAAVGAASVPNIRLLSGTYELTQFQPLQFVSGSTKTITGEGARLTTIDANDQSRVIYAQEGSHVTLNDLTLTAGNADFGQQQGPLFEGGAVYIQGAGSLTLSRVAVTGSHARVRGGGIWSESDLTATDTTISGNRVGDVEFGGGEGGGIFATTTADTRLFNTTVSNNTQVPSRLMDGAGIWSAGRLQMVHVTIAANQHSSQANSLYAIGSSTGAFVPELWNTIVSSTSGFACAQVTAPAIGDHNLDTDGSCGLSATGDRPGVDPQLGALTNNTGPTDTHGLAAASPAINAGNPAQCRTADQRGVARPAGACDIGAFEYVAPPPALPGPPPPPDNGELPPPEPGKTVNALPKSGSVRIRLPGTKKFVRLQNAQQVPVGTVFDTRNGHVTLVAAANRQGGTATSEFWAGIFRMTQNKKAKPTTTLTLTEKLSCPKAGKASTAAKKKRKRRLWGDGSGKFRTKGKHSAATVVGTKWLVEDRCTSTLTRVVRGKVSVRDFVKKKTITLQKGKRYIARAKNA